MLEIVLSIPFSVSVFGADEPYRQLKSSIYLQVFFHLITRTNNKVLKNQKVRICLSEVHLDCM